MDDNTERGQQEEQFTDYNLDHRETAMPIIPASWQDVERLLRAIFTDNDVMGFMVGENHAFLQGDTGEAIFAWLRESPWVGVRPQQDIEREMSRTGKRLLEIVTESEDYRGGYQRLFEICLYRLGEYRTRLSIRSYSKAVPVVRLHKRMVSQIRQTWLDTTQKDRTPEQPQSKTPAPASITPNKTTQAPLPDDLTRRQREVAYLLGQGLRIPEISNQLIISRETVKVHFRNMAERWDIDNAKTETMIAEAKRRGYGNG